jgi:hypothetical protein
MEKKNYNPLMYGNANFEDFEIKRDNISIGKFMGVWDDKQKYINFYQKHDIKNGDEIIYLSLGTRYYVVDIQTNLNKNRYSGIADYIGTLNREFNVFVKTEYEYNRNSGSPVYNVGTAINSNIGGRQNAVNITDPFSKLQSEIEKCDTADKPLLYELFEVLKGIGKNTTPVKKGKLSKFGDVIAKYAPIALSVGQIVLSFLGVGGV